MPAGAALRLADVIQTRFDTVGTGALRLSTAGAPLAATSRTYNLGPGGTFGQAIPAVPDSHAIGAGSSAVTIQLRAGEQYRTNLGALNLASTPITVVAKLFNADGGTLGEVPFELAAYGTLQVNRALPTGVANGFAVFTSPTPGARFLAYSSVVDNGSNDPVYVAAER